MTSEHTDSPLDMEKLDVAYFPYSSDDNPYVLRMRDALSALCNVPPPPSMALFVRKPLRYLRKFDVAIFNWIDNSLAGPRGGFSPRGACVYFLKILYGKMLARKTIFVRHNNYPHACAEASSGLCRKIVDFSEKVFDCTIIHSGAETGENRLYVPHPIYFEAMPDISQDQVKGDEYYLVFGRIQRYKEIEKLILRIPADVPLLVAGPCSDQAYLDQLQQLARGKNVRINAGFLSEENAVLAVSRSKGVILSHAGADMIVSGTYFFAASLGVPVFAKVTPFFDWLRGTGNAKGLYVFKTEEDLVDVLQSGKVETDAWAPIREFALASFGIESVRKHWERVFRHLELIPGSLSTPRT